MFALQVVRQPETFAKPVTDGAPAARRHFEKSVMLCLISNLATSRRRSILGFRLLLGVLQRFQPEKGLATVSGCLFFLKILAFRQIGIRDKFTAQKSFYRKIILNKHSFILFAYSLMTRQMSFQTRKRAIQ